MTKNSVAIKDNYRNKGPIFERVVKRALQWAFPGARIFRGQQAVEGGAGESDVETPIFHIEAKWKKMVNFRSAYKQAVEDADPAKVPVVVGLDDPDDSGAAQAMVYMSLKDFLCLIHALWEGWGGARVAKSLDLSNHTPPPVSVFWGTADTGDQQGGDDGGDNEEAEDAEEGFEEGD
jgi:hypothetical protein